MKEVLVPDINGQWSCETWERLKIEPQECSVAEFSFKFTGLLGIRVVVIDPQARSWAWVFDEVSEMWVTPDTDATPIPESAFGEMRMASVQDDLYEVSTIEMDVVFRAKEGYLELSAAT